MPESIVGVGVWTFCTGKTVGPKIVSSTRNPCVDPIDTPMIPMISYDMGLIASGKRLHNYGKSPCLMGKFTISMTIFKFANCNKLPEGRVFPTFDAHFFHHFPPGGRHHRTAWGGTRKKTADWGASVKVFHQGTG